MVTPEDSIARERNPAPRHPTHQAKKILPLSKIKNCEYLIRRVTLLVCFLDLFCYFCMCMEPLRLARWGWQRARRCLEAYQGLGPFWSLLPRARSSAWRSSWCLERARGRRGLACDRRHWRFAMPYAAVLTTTKPEFFSVDDFGCEIFPHKIWFFFFFFRSFLLECRWVAPLPWFADKWKGISYVVYPNKDKRHKVRIRKLAAASERHEERKREEGAPEIVFTL